MNQIINILTDTGEDSKLVYRRKRPKVDAIIFFYFFRRVRATSMTQRPVKNTRVHLWTFSPVSAKGHGFVRVGPIKPSLTNFS